MIKTAAQLTAAGLAGIVVVKVSGLFVLPMIGLIVGILGLALKIAFVMAVGYFVLSLLKKNRGEDEDEGGEAEIEIEVEVEEVD